MPGEPIGPSQRGSNADSSALDAPALPRGLVDGIEPHQRTNGHGNVGSNGFASGRARTIARVGQVCGIILLLVLTGGLLYVPDATLPIFWKGVVPLLPATFLVSPVIWRSICPLATLNMAGNRPGGVRRISLAARPIVEAAGVGLLFVIVPARLFSLNVDASVLAALIVAIGLVAFVSGFFFDRKAGFCNSICPVLPVEKLYGQYPLIALDNPRCSDCTLCTQKGCVDLAPTKSLAQSLGPRKGDNSWLSKPYGVFAGTFPGFVLGYFLTSRLAGVTPVQTYLLIGGGAVLSYLILSVAVRAFHADRSRSTVATAATAVSVYYWFALPDFARLIGLNLAAASVVRFAAVAFVLFWAYRAILLIRLREGHRAVR